MILATGESTSRLADDDGRRVSWGGCGELRRVCSGCLDGLVLGGGCEASSNGGGGAAGNLKLCEKELDGFLPVSGGPGVLGVVVTPGRRLLERVMRARSAVSPPERGEGCVAERWPGEATAVVSAQEEARCVRSAYLDTSLACRARLADLQIFHALLLGV